jgi:diguanylate cyclase (GGDEF)-like protein
VIALPDTERRRRAAVAEYGPADPENHAGIGAASRLVAHFLDVPMAGVGLVRGCEIELCGSVGVEAHRVPRRWAAFDRLVELPDTGLVVLPNTGDDPAFNQRPIHVSAFAAAALRTPDGDVIGGLFAADHMPRRFSETQLAILEGAAGLVMAELSARRQYVTPDPATRQFEWLLRDPTDSVAVLDYDGAIVWASPSLQRDLGYELGVLGYASQLVHVEDMPLVVGAVTVAMARPGITGPVEFRMAHGDGTWRIMEAVFSNCFDSPAVGGVAVYLRDVTDRTRHADILAAEARVLTGIARRYPLADVLRSIIDLVHGNIPGAEVVIDVDAPGHMLVKQRDGRSHTDAEQRLIATASSLVALAFDRQQPGPNRGARPPSGGVVPRTELVTRLESVLARASVQKEKVAVLLLDLDRFKEVNEGLGHDVGDRVLPMVATRLREVVRPHDVVVRVAGDEFAVVCEGLVGELEAVGVAERINLCLRDPFHIGRNDVRITASIGIAMTHGDGDHAEALLRDADAALYNAKQKGRARFEVFNESRRREAMARRELDTELERALEQGELRVWLQPEIELATGRLIGFEALVRWEHPERGLLAPGEFIPQAERSGLIDRVGGWVLEEACRYGRQWRDAHAADGSFVVAVNLSARQLAAPDLPARVSAALAESGLEPHELCLELTESALMDDADASLVALRALKQLGVRLAIDDFGTGYSSLAYLRRFPIDAVKIDRSFVSGLGSRAEDAAIVTAVLSLTRALGLTAIAEGVEHDHQRLELVRLGCATAQGFFFSPPRPAEEMLVR